MRPQLLAAALASASCLASRTLAAPTPDPQSEVSPPGLEEPSQPAADEASKYFHEPGVGDQLHHYDDRFFRGQVHDAEREETLHHMIRAYLHIFRAKGIETWIAHGSLLGWWWNGKMLPWDWDVDVQVTEQTLRYLAAELNGTRHKYASDDGAVRREYLLDVNPHAVERERGDGMNVIDARWVDVRNGLFVDITALSETHPDVSPGLLSCKNFHSYRTEDLYPMRESVYEGVPVLIPYAYDHILAEEYESKALFVTEYEGYVVSPSGRVLLTFSHRWDPAHREWMRTGGEQVPQELVGPPRPHIPQSVQTRSTAPGLANIMRLVRGS
ncbi:MAG: hypothetical protein M1832_006054 [Thelocarpon impressellum]|nr:MAG: hypothetical protein M1832_006054 [Thelocarpon impressellum]